MAISEIYPNPTVKGVHFEVRFPNLFYIEKKIGDFQMKIMKLFPESALLLRRQLFLADVGPEGKIENAPEGLETEAVKKIWNFKSKTGIDVNVLNNSLQIHSTHHKTYDNPASSDKFRDLIKYVIDGFLEVTGIPVITRLGLRYIDECPVINKDNKTFQEWYNTTFPLARFNLADTIDMSFKTIVRKGPYLLRYIEELKSRDGRYALTFDFDGYVEAIDTANYLSITDALHKLISDEFELSIKKPVYDYMKQVKPEQK